MRGLHSIVGVMVVSLLLGGCYLLDFHTADRMPTLALAPKSPGHNPPLVIVLPGRGDDLDDLRDSGIGDVIQQAIPESEVLLVGATLAYYREGRLIPRLQDEIVRPARARGIREIWLTGISMGGMGTLLYEHEHPGEMTGLVLFSPYMGEHDLVSEVAAAGGPATWNPGPVPGVIDAGNAMRLEWITVKRWTEQPATTQRVWLSCGTTDRLRDASLLLAPLLPPVHFYAPEGGHEWKVWLPASREMFARIATARASRQSSTPVPEISAGR